LKNYKTIPRSLYALNAISPPNKKQTIFFLLKLYLSNNFVDASFLSEYLTFPPQRKVLTATQIITGLDSNDKLLKFITNLNLSDNDNIKDLQKAFVSEILLNFNQILGVTTLDIWHFNKEHTRQKMAFQNLKVAMNSKSSNEFQK
jgi:hypothetical protein